MTTTKAFDHYYAINCLINLILLWLESYHYNFAKLWDSFFPNFTADGVDILRNFEQLLNQTSFTWKDGLTIESKLKMIHIHHQNHPPKTSSQSIVIFPEEIEKGIAGKYTLLQQKLVNRKIKQNPLDKVSPKLPNVVRKSQIFQVFQTQRVEANWTFHSMKERKLCYNCFKKDHYNKMFI